MQRFKTVRISPHIKSVFKILNHIDVSFNTNSLFSRNARFQHGAPHVGNCYTIVRIQLSVVLLGIKNISVQTCNKIRKGPIKIINVLKVFNFFHIFFLPNPLTAHFDFNSNSRFFICKLKIKLWLLNYFLLDPPMKQQTLKALLFLNGPSSADSLLIGIQSCGTFTHRNIFPCSTWSPQGKFFRKGDNRATVAGPHKCKKRLACSSKHRPPL